MAINTGSTKRGKIMKKLFKYAVIVSLVVVFQILQCLPGYGMDNLTGFKQRGKVLSLRDHYMLYGDNTEHLQLGSWWYTAEGTNDNFRDMLYSASGEVVSPIARPKYRASTDGVMGITFISDAVTPLDKKDGWYAAGDNAMSDGLTFPRKISTQFVLPEGIKGENLGFEFDYSGVTESAAASSPRILWELSVYDKEAGRAATTTSSYYGRAIKGGVGQVALQDTWSKASSATVTLLAASDAVSTNFIKGVEAGETVRLDVWATTPINIRAIRYYKHGDYSDRDL